MACFPFHPTLFPLSFHPPCVSYFSVSVYISFCTLTHPYPQAWHGGDIAPDEIDPALAVELAESEAAHDQAGSQKSAIKNLPIRHQDDGALKLSTSGAQVPMEATRDAMSLGQQARLMSNTKADADAGTTDSDDTEPHNERAALGQTTLQSHGRRPLSQISRTSASEDAEETPAHADAQPRAKRARWTQAPSELQLVAALWQLERPSAALRLSSEDEMNVLQHLALLSPPETPPASPQSPPTPGSPTAFIDAASHAAYATPTPFRPVQVLQHNAQEMSGPSQHAEGPRRGHAPSARTTSAQTSLAPQARHGLRAHRTSPPVQDASSYTPSQQPHSPSQPRASGTPLAPSTSRASNRARLTQFAVDATPAASHHVEATLRAIGPHVPATPAASALRRQPQTFASRHSSPHLQFDVASAEQTPASSMTTPGTPTPLEQRVGAPQALLQTGAGAYGGPHSPATRLALRLRRKAAGPVPFPSPHRATPRTSRSASGSQRADGDGTLVLAQGTASAEPVQRLRFSPVPPTTEALLASMQDMGMLLTVHTAAHFTQRSDIPVASRTLAGDVCRWTLPGVAGLPPWSSVMGSHGEAARRLLSQYGAEAACRESHVVEAAGSVLSRDPYQFACLRRTRWRLHHLTVLTPARPPPSRRAAEAWLAVHPPAPSPQPVRRSNADSSDVQDRTQGMSSV
jgi:hypothetical protein